MNIGIVGGGLTGLMAAYELTRRGHQVTVWEKGPESGGQLGTFRVGGGRVERFYHHLFRQDADLIRLIEELGLGERVVWLESRVGFYHQGRLYNFVTPSDLLKFNPIGLTDRLRLGLVSLYLQRSQDWRKFEGVTARDWISRYAGKHNYEMVWRPLLEGKFGDRADEVGMVWFWSKVFIRFASRSPGMGRERLGYLMGSFGLLVDALAQRIYQQGGAIQNAAVRRIVVRGGRVAGAETEHGFHPLDAIIATVPCPTLLALAPDLPRDYAASLAGIRYQAAACLALVLKESLSHFYWLNIADPQAPFPLVVEHTNFIEPSHYGGKHILYLANYLSPESPLYHADADQLLAHYLPYPAKINPRFTPAWIEDCHIFREEAGTPIFTARYSAPDHRTPIGGLYLANTSQSYPEDRSMNVAVRLGRKVSRLVEADASGG